MCLPYLKLSYQLPKTHIFFIWPNGLIGNPKLNKIKHMPGMYTIKPKSTQCALITSTKAEEYTSNNYPDNCMCNLDQHFHLFPIGLHNLSDLQCAIENYFSHFSTKTYVVGTQKNCLIETILLSTPNTCLN